MPFAFNQNMEFTMKTYETLSEAVTDLQKDGYTHDFQMNFDCLTCEGVDQSYHPDTFDVDQVHRFEGMTNPGDSSVIYAIQAKDGRKGLLIDAYGAYSDPISIEMIEKFQMPNRSKK